MRTKLRRNDPCFCGSGKKYKKCHLGREAEQPVAAWEYANEIRRLADRKLCYHPDAPGACEGRKVAAHTVQRRRVLSSIARNGEVYRFHLDAYKLGAADYGIEVQPIGVSVASTFHGFCAKHDRDTFLPIENETFLGTDEQCFLHGYRAITHELFKKENIAALTPKLRSGDRGKGIVEQVLIQSRLHPFETGASYDLRDISDLKRSCDAMYTKRDFSRWRHITFWFDQPLGFACSGVFNPEVSFDGVRLQSLQTTSSKLDTAVLGVFPAGTEGCALLAWIDTDSDASQALADSLVALEPSAIGNAVIRLAIEHLENVYLSPDWWDGLDESERRSLLARFTHGLDTFIERPQSALSDDGVRVVKATRNRVQKNY